MALEAELLELPEMPGRRLLVAVWPEVIEIEVVPAAGRVLGEQSGDLDGVIARRHTAAHLQIGRGAAVLVQVEIMRRCHAIDRDADLAAVGIDEERICYQTPDRQRAAS